MSADANGKLFTEIGLDEIRELRRPFTPAAVKFKIQTAPKPKQGGSGHTQAMIVTYIDARLVVERLNHVLGFTWTDSYGPGPNDQGLQCTISLGQVHRSDIGFSDDPGTDIGLKALYSDAFKRAAVKYGVGVSLYALPRLYRPPDALTHRAGRGGDKWFLPDRLLPDLRKTYESWLHDEGIKAYGEPLDHGDSIDAQGDVEGEPEQVDVDAGDPLARDRGKALFMASALASKAEIDVSDLRDKVNAAVDRDELVALYRAFAVDLKKFGGDPRMVGQRFEEAHPVAA